MVEALYLIQSSATSSLAAATTSQRSSAAATVTTTHTSPSKPISAAPVFAQDKVTLSASAQAHQLQHQGRSVAEIAAELGTTTAGVDAYLGITNTTDPAAGLHIATTLPFGPAASQPAARAV